MEERRRIVGDVSNRLYLGGMAALCWVGSSALVLSVIWLWKTGFVAFAAMVALGWFVISGPWFLLMGLVVADMSLYLFTGTTLMLPAIFRSVSRENAQRRLAKRPTLAEESTWARRVMSDLAFYTNPLMPLLFGAILFLVTKPAMDAVDETVDRMQFDGRAYRVVGGLGSDIQSHVGRGARLI